MKIEVIEKSKEKVTLKLPVGVEFANLLRREILENLPTMEIREVEIRKNSSALYDEMLAHRLGLIPLVTDLDSYDMPGEEESLKTHLKLILKAKGPCTVYSSDIISKDPKVKPAQGTIPIVKLLKGQEIEVEATATLGLGKEHMKFSPGLAYYWQAAEFKAKPLKNAKEIISKCPKGVFEVKKDVIVPLDNRCHLWDTCLQFAPEKSIEIKEKNEVIFTVESWGQLEPINMVKIAMDRFIEDLKLFEKEWK